MNRTKDELLLECIEQFEHIENVLGCNRLTTTRSLIDEINRALTIPAVNKRKFNLNELRHIAVNFAITCENGYKGDFDSWFNGISGEWRKIANRK